VVGARNDPGLPSEKEVYPGFVEAETAGVGDRVESGDMGDGDECRGEGRGRVLNWSLCGVLWVLLLLSVLLCLYMLV
jgi:hypothetical protein